MKISIDSVPTKEFKPIGINIVIESIDELKSLWLRTNGGLCSVIGTSSNDALEVLNINKDSTDNVWDLWEMLDDKLRECYPNL